MAGRIQGITALIGDTTKLQTALKGVNTEIRNTQNQLRDADKLLKLDPGNTELLACHNSKATGIAQSTISDWKRKKTNPSADKIMIICKVLKVTPYELLQDSVQPVEELDYRVVTKGTKEYDLLIEMESLKKSQKERLLGYIEALKQ